MFYLLCVKINYLNLDLLDVTVDAALAQSPL